MESNISVVIVTWNNENDIQECLEGILNQDYGNYQVIVVDNESQDKTVEIIKNSYPKVVLLEQSENHYLTGGNNIGIKYAMEKYNSEFVMVLNPDTKIEQNLLSSLYSVISAGKSIGAVGPKVKFYKNKDEGLLNSVGLVFDGFNQAYDVGFLEEDKGQYNEINEVFGVTGACILYRVAMLKEIGLYWEKIKLHLDEVELFIRAKKGGWKVKYVPTTTVWHKYMRSTDQNRLYEIEKAKKKVWFWIAVRHYSLLSKLAMLKKYLFE